MKVSFKNGVLTVDTEIKKSELDDAKNNRLVLKEKDGDGFEVEAFTVTLNETAASLTETNITCNGISEEKTLVANIIVGSKATEADAKKAYGDAVVAASKAIPKILEQIKVRSKAISDAWK